MKKQIDWGIVEKIAIHFCGPDAFALYRPERKGYEYGFIRDDTGENLAIFQKKPNSKASLHWRASYFPVGVAAITAELARAYVDFEVGECFELENGELLIGDQALLYAAEHIKEIWGIKMQESGGDLSSIEKMHLN